MRKVREDFEAEPKESNGENDHVHPLVHHPPKIAISKLVNNLKGVSARTLHPDLTGPEPSDHAPAPLVPALLRSTLRRHATVDQPAIHRTTATPGLTAGRCSRMC
jgi:REP element-mobilizing transposase RayT